MAEATENNPFSFKSFVKSKEPKIEKSHEQKISKNHPLNQRKEKIIEDESPFPEVSTSLDDLASRNKRVLQIIDDEVQEVTSALESASPNGEQFDTKTDSVSETDSDSESENASCAQSPVSGSVHYFIAPLESSKAQDLVVEELNQLKEENEKLRRELKASKEAREQDKNRITSLQKKLAKIEKREADETAALENMVQMVEKNLELTTQRALRAETTVSKLKEEVSILKTESIPIATYNQLLDANESTMIAVRDKSRAASDQMNAAAKNAGQAIRYDHVHVVTLTTFVLCTKAKQFIILMTVLT
ncbi:PREDICTED: serologically defined colon cancer antigen 3 homolog isoform X2 [Acropora digitifera]|uniref:serologically defined colon cancer antigen 3 homolog isoform X2 n=1 Tax=Acropora digitifera TaxID=70779 RepID=UPI00077AFCD7|nr:PREDICTED: serologically defined colon cancer antigen 3 homolog isoform X2 [Acropora digitifera]